MLEVLALAKDMNMQSQGSDNTPSNDVVELSAKEKEIAENLGLTEEEFAKYNK